MKMSNMCEYMRWMYTMDGFIQWSEMWRGMRWSGGSCCRRLEEDVSNWGRVGVGIVRSARSARINYSINEVIIVLYKN